MSAKLYQVLSAIILNFNVFSLGLIFAWPSSTLQLFKSDATPLHRPMTDTELSLLGSLMSIGALISNPFAGMFLDRLGRKKCALAASCLGSLAWALIAVCNRVEAILAAILVSGLSGSIFLVVPVFVSEFSEDSIRGILTSGAVVFYGFGILLSYLLGGFLEYKMMIYACLTMAVTGLALLMILKESPTLLMKKGLEEEAKKSMAFYRHAHPDSKEILQEMEKIKKTLNPDAEELTEMASPEEEKLTLEIEQKAPVKKLSALQFMKKSRSSQRAIVILLVLMTAAIFQGMIVVLVYAKPLFSEAVPKEILSATWCSVLLAVVSVLSGMVAAYLTDLAGRRILMISSSLAAGVCCILLGTQIHLHWGPHWLTAIFIYIFNAIFTLGAGTVPYVLLAELFLPEVKSLMSMVVMEWTWFCSFIVLFVFNPLVGVIGLGPVFYIFATMCFLTAIFAYFFLPETKGLPIHEIQLQLVKRS